MPIIKADTRRVEKRTILTGVTPTVPPSADFTDGTWSNTDIMAGELFFNVPDQKLWIGTGTGAIQLLSSLSGGEDLSVTLTIGNTTGANNIIITDGQYIGSASGSQLNFSNLGEFKVGGKYNTVIKPEIIYFSDNNVLSHTTPASVGNKLPNIFLSAQSCIGGAGTHSNIITGTGNELNDALAAYNLIGGINNKVNGPTLGINRTTNIIWGNSLTLSNQPNTFSQNIYIGVTTNISNTASIGNNFISCSNTTINSNTLIISNYISGATQTLSANNILRNYISGSSIILNGTSTIQNSIISGTNNTISANFSNSLIVGQNITTFGTTLNNLIGGKLMTLNNNIEGCALIGGGHNVDNIFGSFIGGYAAKKNPTTSVLGSLVIGYGNQIDADGIVYGSLNTSTLVGTTGLVALGARSSSNTTIVLTTDPGDAGSRFYIEDQGVYKMSISLIATTNSGLATQVWDANGIIRRLSGTVSIVSAFSFTSFFTNVLFSSTVVSVVANNTNKSMDLTINTGTASTINWVANVRYEKVYV